MTNPAMDMWLRAWSETTSRNGASMASEFGRQQADLVKVWMDAWVEMTYPWLPGELSGRKRKSKGHVGV